MVRKRQHLRRMWQSLNVKLNTFFLPQRQSRIKYPVDTRKEKAKVKPQKVQLQSELFEGLTTQEQLTNRI